MSDPRTGKQCAACRDSRHDDCSGWCFCEDPEHGPHGARTEFPERYVPAEVFGGSSERPYAPTRLDALRRLRDEGYAVVDREGYERMRAENERFRTALERIAKEPAPGRTTACANIAKTALTGSRHDPHGVLACLRCGKPTDHPSRLCARCDLETR